MGIKGGDRGVKGGDRWIQGGDRGLKGGESSPHTWLLTQVQGQVTRVATTD